MSSTPQEPSSTSTTTSIARPSSGRHHQLHHEDLLLRTWRSMAQLVASITSKAEKVAAAADPLNNRDAAKELNEATVVFLRTHMEWGRSISYLEAKLQGKAAEMEALQHYVRSHPSMGRKRKRPEPSSSAAASDHEKPAANASSPSAPVL